MVFARSLSSKIRSGIVASTKLSSFNKANSFFQHQQQFRHMGGGGGYLRTSPIHQFWAEAFGVVCWLWVFYRARLDGPVLLGWRHPWEHDSHDDHDDEHGEH